VSTSAEILSIRLMVVAEWLELVHQCIRHTQTGFGI